MAIGNDRKYRMDMCHGPLFSQIVRFSLPLFMSQMIQLLFNAADLIVVGRYAQHEAMAAVGSTASVTFLLINVFFGLSRGHWHTSQPGDTHTERYTASSTALST